VGFHVENTDLFHIFEQIFNSSSFSMNVAITFVKLQGIKPAALSKVKDVAVRSFVERCLASAADRLPASELLNSSFLHKDDDINEKSSNSVHRPVAFPQNLELDLDAAPIFVSTLLTNDRKESCSMVLRKGELVLEGNMNVINPVSLLLRLPDSNGNHNISFCICIEQNSVFFPFTN
jgi:WNK lysine deficient protein kinase